ncbi:ABC transporter substrate-binding protein [Candidatus Haliotispira prima]|uniref:ABC transporter substrate-binding protein n=1 Tax=Candidatus Haliotispira prima TaxID=3034016 RepID=A0ABY8MFM9_9SPIO|nr:ABC transporter substrate-binding protein [Candidatus Haliotispira prima]
MQNILRHTLRRAGYAPAILIGLAVLLQLSCNRQNTDNSGKHTPGDSGQEAQKQEQLEDITFALDWTPNTNHTGLYVAQKLGYFADAGLRIDIKMPQTSVTQLVASGRVSFGIGFQEFGTSSIANESMPIVSVAAVLRHNTSGFTSMKDRNIKRPLDFGGKLYAGWGNPFETKLIRYLIQLDGGDPEQFESVTIGEASLAGLLQDRVDYAWTFYAWQNIGFDLQGLETHYIPLKDLDPVFDYYTPIIIANRSYLEQNRNSAQRFIQAVAKGYEYAAQNAEEAAEILLDFAPELDRELVMRSQEYLAQYYLDEDGKWGRQNPETWNNLAQWMYDNQLIKKPLSAEDAMTNELLLP